ncbi:MAG: PIN domain-containing protein [Gemmatimonadota bacterium]
MAVVDTHALRWAALGLSRKLGREARRLISRADTGRAAIYVPTIVLVEVGEAAWRGRVRLRGGFSSWTLGLFSNPSYVPLEPTTAVVLRAQELYGISERSDRLIAASALELGCPVMTADPEITAHPEVETLW